MTEQKRGLSGSSSSSSSSSSGATTGRRKGDKITGKFLVSHRQGPFLIHLDDSCDPKAGRCNNGFDNLVDQGFAPCPKCMK